MECRNCKNALKKSTVEISISTAAETASETPENCAFWPFEILKTVKLKMGTPKNRFSAAHSTERRGEDDGKAGARRLLLVASHKTRQNAPEGSAF